MAKAKIRISHFTTKKIPITIFNSTTPTTNEAQSVVEKSSAAVSKQIPGQISIPHTVVDSDARRVVRSFLPTAENYRN